MVNMKSQEEELRSSQLEYIQRIRESLMPGNGGNENEGEIEFLLKRL